MGGAENSTGYSVGYFDNVMCHPVSPGAHAATPRIPTLTAKSLRYSINKHIRFFMKMHLSCLLNYHVSRSCHVLAGDALLSSGYVGCIYGIDGRAEFTGANVLVM